MYLKNLGKAATLPALPLIMPLNSINSVQKALDLTTPAKNSRKLSIIDLNFQIKKLVSLASRLVYNWPYKLTTRSLVFCEI
jgi:hypothetical protein